MAGEWIIRRIAEDGPEEEMGSRAADTQVVRTEEEARRRYDELSANLYDGEVQLIAPDGQVCARALHIGNGIILGLRRDGAEWRFERWRVLGTAPHSFPPQEEAKHFKTQHAAVRAFWDVWGV